MKRSRGIAHAASAPLPSRADADSKAPIVKPQKEKKQVRADSGKPSKAAADATPVDGSLSFSQLLTKMAPAQAPEPAPARSRVRGRAAAAAATAADSSKADDDADDLPDEATFAAQLASVRETDPTFWKYLQEGEQRSGLLRAAGVAVGRGKGFAAAKDDEDANEDDDSEDDGDSGGEHEADDDEDALSAALDADGNEEDMTGDSEGATGGAAMRARPSAGVRDPALDGAVGDAPMLTSATVRAITASAFDEMTFRGECTLNWDACPPPPPLPTSFRLCAHDRGPGALLFWGVARE